MENKEKGRRRDFGSSGFSYRDTRSYPVFEKRSLDYRLYRDRSHRMTQLDLRETRIKGFLPDE